MLLNRQSKLVSTGSLPSLLGRCNKYLLYRQFKTVKVTRVRERKWLFQNRAFYVTPTKKVMSLNIADGVDVF